MLRCAATVCLLGAILLGTVGSAAARTSFNAFAAINYTQYESEDKSGRLFSGSSLTQDYSVAWRATNLVMRDQPRYYTLMAGYDWKSFNTDVTFMEQDNEYKGSYGKFRYNLSVGYSPPTLPLRFTAYMRDENYPRYLINISPSDRIIEDTLTYDFQGRGTVASRGFVFDFYPSNAREKQLRGLPGLHLDYRETRSKSEDLVSTDVQTTDFVASLYKGVNWLNYRVSKTDDYSLNINNEQKQLQIGHVDFNGRRYWAALTNWITVSADGQLITRTGAGKSDRSDEYDVNLQAAAYRKFWEAKTFLNYNRRMLHEELTENVRVPLYVKGLWGGDADWYLHVSAERGRQRETLVSPIEKSYVNSISAGGTMFKRASFTVSPSLLLKTEKYFYGVDSYEASAGVEAASTGRFSNRLFLAAGYVLRTRDDGFGTELSQTWSNKFYFNGKYQPSRALVYELRETIDAGTGPGFIETSRLSSAGIASPGLSNYFRSNTSASVGYTGSAAFSASLSASYDLIMNSGLPNNELYTFSSRASYKKGNTLFSFSFRGVRHDDGISPVTTEMHSYLDLLYRPNRYHDGSLRYTLTKNFSTGVDSTKHELLQRQIYSFFTTKGVSRNFASITEEFSYISENGYVTKYLMLRGRYSPITRLTLSGYVMYKADPGAVTMLYNVGVGANFKLFSTSLDYSLAQRDIDDRIEKKLTASFLRSF